MKTDEMNPTYSASPSTTEEAWGDQLSQLIYYKPGNKNMLLLAIMTKFKLPPVQW